MLLTYALLAGCASAANAANLIVSSYNGNITTFELSSAESTTQGCTSNSAYELKEISTLNTTTQSPSWLTFNHQNQVLYLMDEAMSSGDGTVVSYKVQSNGSLSEVQRVKALAGGVHGHFYNSGTALAVAHYSSSSLRTYTVDATGHMKDLETFKFKLDKPGPVADSQAAPHPHEAIRDPTGNFLLVPDLGADLVRTFSIDHTTSKLTMGTPLVAAPGSGPRHAVFSHGPISGSYKFYLVSELSGTVTAYDVAYPKAGGIAFTAIKNGVYDVRGPGSHPKMPAGAGPAPAEIHFSPGGRFLMVTDRRDSTFAAKAPGNPFNERSDAIITYTVKSDGSLGFLQLVPAGGSFPRQFSQNRAGTLAAVGLQQSERIVIIERNTVTGKFGDIVASTFFAGNATCIVWNE